MIEQIAIIGAGSMGLNMSLLFGDHDVKVSIYDVAGENIDKLNDLLKEHEDRKKYVTGFKSLDEFLESLRGQRVFLFSLTHGKPVDEVIQSLKPHFKKGDIILDGGNEWYEETERRQKELKEIGVEFIGMGVSGGYQSARRGPSLCPGGEKSTYDKVSELLEKVSAKYHGSPCVAYMGPAGAGHYVKMVHNGIEQGMLSITSEAYEIMHRVLGFSNDRIGKIFTEWNADGELKNNFLVKICGEIAPRKQDDGKHIVDIIEDRVVQDADGSEGTGVWSVKEAGERHVPCPTIATAHFMRTASAHRDDREKVHKLWTSITDNLKPATEDPEIVLESLRLAVHAGFLASFIQGLNLIAQASLDFKWKLHMPTVLDIWRSGCIIEAEYLSQMFMRGYEGQKKGDDPLRDVAVTQPVADEVNKSFKALKQIVLMSINADAHVPALSASLEYLKYTASVQLPTAFEEAQLDYFGGHSYDTVNEDVLKVKKGSHHTEWKKP